LKSDRLAKLTEVGKLFHTRTILSAKNRLRVLWLQWNLYTLYAWPLVLVTRLNSKKSYARWPQRRPKALPAMQNASRKSSGGGKNNEVRGETKFTFCFKGK